MVTHRPPNQPTLEIRLDSHGNNQRMCALAMLENQAGNIRSQSWSNISRITAC